MSQECVGAQMVNYFLKFGRPTFYLSFLSLNIERLSGHGHNILTEISTEVVHTSELSCHMCQ